MRLCRTFLAVVIALGAAHGTPAVQAKGPASAQSPKAAAAKAEAAKEFKAGVAAFKKKQFIEAAEHFEAAYAIAPHPTALWNAADAREKAGELAPAANLYARYLDSAAEGDKDRYEAKQRLNNLSMVLGRLELSGPDASDIKIDRKLVEGQTLVYVDPGDHVVTAKAEGKFLSKNVSVAAGAKVLVRLVPQSETPTPVTTTSAQDPPLPPKRKGVSPVVVVAGAGVTAVLAGVTIWSGLDTRSKRNEFDANPSSRLYDEGVAAQNRTNILIGVTAAVGVATAAIAVFAVKWRNPKEPQLSAMPGGVSFSMRF